MVKWSEYGHHWSATLDNRKNGKGCLECGAKNRAKSNRKRGALGFNRRVNEHRDKVETAAREGL